MTYFKNILGVIVILALLSSCGERANNNSSKQETPKALQDNKLDLKSYSRSNDDLVEDLYQELVEKTPALKKLEDDINTFNSKSGEPTDKFNKYHSKLVTYYSSAENKVASISDSTLKNKIQALIKNSESKYENKTSELNSLFSRITENNVTLNDHHSVLKIVLTLPLMEQYQHDNLPDKKEFQKLIKEQEKLIGQTDSLTTAQQ